MNLTRNIWPHEWLPKLEVLVQSKALQVGKSCEVSWQFFSTFSPNTDVDLVERILSPAFGSLSYQAIHPFRCCGDNTSLDYINICVHRDSSITTLFTTTVVLGFTTSPPVHQLIRPRLTQIFRHRYRTVNGHSSVDKSNSSALATSS